MRQAYEIGYIVFGVYYSEVERNWFTTFGSYYKTTQ